MSTGPVARVGDATVHGGAIVQGDPTLLVDGMPVATVGSMHVCPMVNPGTPPPPHVGGPVTQGVPWFTVNGRAVATVGCVCVCCGPPDVIAMGSPSLVVGSGSTKHDRVGGSGSSPRISSSACSAAVATRPQPEEAVRDSCCLSVQVTDSGAKAAAAASYATSGPGVSRRSGFLPGNGHMQRSLPQEVETTFTVPAIYGARWSCREIEAGEEVTVTARVLGTEDGSPATVRVYSVSASRGAALIRVIETSVTGDEISASLAVSVDEMNGDPVRVLRATVHVEECLRQAQTQDIIVSIPANSSGGA